MDKKTFLQGSLSLGALSLLPTNSMSGQRINELETDKLTDESGNFANKRADLVDALFNIINREDVEQRLEQALKLT